MIRSAAYAIIVALTMVFWMLLHMLATRIHAEPR